MKVLQQADIASEIAREAFAIGDLVTGIAAIQLAAQLTQLARLLPDRAIQTGAVRIADHG